VEGRRIGFIPAVNAEALRSRRRKVMALSMVSFVGAIVIPACAFYLYALSQFLREALRMRKQRLSAERRTAEPESVPARAQDRGTVLTFLPNSGRSSHRGAA
jgi:hypothetical protein